MDIHENCVTLDMRVAIVLPRVLQSAGCIRTVCILGMCCIKMFFFFILDMKIDIFKDTSTDAVEQVHKLSTDYFLAMLTK